MLGKSHSDDSWLSLRKYSICYGHHFSKREPPRKPTLEQLQSGRAVWVMWNGVGWWVVLSLASSSRAAIRSYWLTWLIVVLTFQRWNFLQSSELSYCPQIPWETIHRPLCTRNEAHIPPSWNTQRRLASVDRRSCRLFLKLKTLESQPC